MPFKTRRQKISASRRRYSFLENQTVRWEERSLKASEIQRATEAKVNSKRIEASYQYVRRDLLKIALLAGVIIIGQTIIKFIIH